MKRIPGWLWLLWVSVGLLLEGIAIGTAERGDTLTETILGTLPGALILVAVAWISWHFGIRVFRRRQLEARRAAFFTPLDDPDGGRRGD